MQIADISVNSDFRGAVAAAISHVCGGPDADLAALLVSSTPRAKRMLVATELGVIDCTMDFDRPAKPNTLVTTPPLSVKLTTWRAWPPVGLAGDVYVIDGSVSDDEWRLEGERFADFERPDHAADRIDPRVRLGVD